MGIEKPLKKGNELFMSYGHTKSNLELFFNYGFFYRDRPSEAVQEELRHPQPTSHNLTDMCKKDTVAWRMDASLISAFKWLLCFARVVSLSSNASGGAWNPSVGPFSGSEELRAVRFLRGWAEERMQRFPAITDATHTRSVMSIGVGTSCKE